MRYLPAQPIVVLIEARGGLGACGIRCSRLRRAYTRAKREGVVTIWAADKLAIAIGHHPSLVWVDAWWSPDYLAATSPIS